jgi:protein ImuB
VNGFYRVLQGSTRFDEVHGWRTQSNPVEPSRTLQNLVESGSLWTPLYACLRGDPGCVPREPRDGLSLSKVGIRPSRTSGRPELAEGRDPRHVLIARDFSPRIECHGASTVVLDVSGLGRLLGDAPAIGAELARAADEYSASLQIAVARSQTAARLLAIERPALRIAAGEAAAAVAPLSIDRLRVFMEDEDARSGKAVARLQATVAHLETFRRWGLTMLGEIAALPSIELSERMGQEGLALQQLARGIDPAPLVPDPGVPRFVQSMELEWPIDALEPLSFVLARLLDPLSSSLERADRGAAALRLDLRLVDRTTYTRVLQLPAAMRDPKVLRTLLLLDLESHPPSQAIDIVTIEIDPVPGRIVQYSLLERALPSPETLATLTARLCALVGESRCGSPVLLDTWRPDGFEMQRFAPSSQLPVPSCQKPASRQPSLHLPESEGCLAEAAQPRRRTGTLILRRFRPPVAVRVTVERGRPIRIAIDRRGMPGGHVERAAGPWRSSGAWWDDSAAAWDRDEWDAALSDGSVCRLFHDRINDRWFLDGILD